ncbi:hypothetical protein Tsubulata_039001 [Turnera subulata]|uniref:Uncharacterized protein n=1 Tax=Turnera subulata TaxID=218843 RepID=A0A9Q0F2A8_9ROSI|nr:hypothetical protein Tsubulata_039001 [Turnera subulata]
MHSEKGARAKPMLCACLSQEQNKMLIVGLCGKLRQAAKEIGAHFFHESFEPSWIVLENSAVNNFMLSSLELIVKLNPKQLHD